MTRAADLQWPVLMLPLALVVAVATAGLSETPPTRLRLIDRPETSGELRPGTGQLIAATATGIVGLVGGGVSLAVFLGPGSVMSVGNGWFPGSYNYAVRGGSMIGIALGGIALLSSAILGTVGLVKWFTAPAPAPEIRLAAWAPKRPPTEPLLMVNVGRF